MRSGVVFLVVLAAAATLAPVLSAYGQHILILIALYGSLALAWNVLGGMAGQISLGHALFVDDPGSFNHLVSDFIRRRIWP